MFTIYVKKVDGIPYDRYFGSWENAKQAMDEEVKYVVERGGNVTRKIDQFISESGYYEYQTDVEYQGREFVFALIDGYFEDV